MNNSDAATSVGKTDVTSEQNIAFWDELCGSHRAKILGVADASIESIKKFDDWYINYYPYLFNKHVPLQELEGKRVLEVGLGYGTISQKIAESGAQLTGLDIAVGPVNMFRHRLKQNNIPGEAFQDSILTAPFEDETFDWVFAIGCYHHTGDLRKALDETFRILKPGGKAVIMVYYAYSFRRWGRSFLSTLKYFLSEYSNINFRGNSSEAERAKYDTNEAGVAAPHTEFISVKQMKNMCKKWSDVNTQLENIGYSILIPLPRSFMIATAGRIAGTDMYCTLTK